MAATLPRTFHRDTPRYDQPVSIPGRICASLMRALDRAGPCLLEREQFGRWSCLPYYCRGDELSREHGKRYPIATVTHDRITPRIAWNRANGRQSSFLLLVGEKSGSVHRLNCAVVAVWWRRGLVLGHGRWVGTWPYRIDRCSPCHLFLAIWLSREKGWAQLGKERGTPGQY